MKIRGWRALYTRRGPRNRYREGGSQQTVAELAADLPTLRSALTKRHCRSAREEPHRGTRAGRQSIERRTALKLAAAALWLATRNRRVVAHTAPQRIVVIGGGIIGCAISYYLAKAGAQVTLVERDGLASKASRGTFRLD